MFNEESKYMVSNSKQPRCPVPMVVRLQVAQCLFTLQCMDRKANLV